MIGAGACGASAALAARQQGFDGRIVVIGDEPRAPYERPPLSKQLLMDPTRGEEVDLHPADRYREAAVELCLGVRATGLDVGGKLVQLADGTALAYDGLLLSTGARARILGSAPPAERVHYLRSVEDALRLEAALEKASRVLVLGAGFVGCEVAASARQRGLEVIVIAADDLPMPTFGPIVGRAMAEAHRDEGVEFHLGQQLASVRDTGSSVVVETHTGRRFEGDLLVVGVGAEANDELAAAAGLTCDAGILVDACCRTNVVGVYAAGDVARHFHPSLGRDIRVEHHQNALDQGAAAGRNMAGNAEAYDEIHWFWSDQYAYNLQALGVPSPGDTTVVRGSIEGRSFSVISLREAHITGVVSVNASRDVLRVRKIMRGRLPVDPSLIGDEACDIRDAVVAAAR
jgi:3-phenylpropionate/trans-cinnamate dioxygenase ferredoxin reductase subunit